MAGRNATCRQSLDGLPQCLGVILDQRVGETGFVALFTAHQAPDQMLVAGVQLIDAGLLLDHFRTIQFHPGLGQDHEIAAQPGRDRHAAEATDHAGDDADDRHVPAQRNDFGMDLGDHGLTEIGLLQPNASRLKQKHRQDCLATLPVAPRQSEGGRYLILKDN